MFTIEELKILEKALLALLEVTHDHDEKERFIELHAKAQVLILKTEPDHDASKI